MAEKLSRAWRAATVLLLLLACSDLVLQRSDGLTDIFFQVQDLPVLLAITLIAAALLLSPPLKLLSGRLLGRLAARLAKPPFGTLDARIAVVGLTAVTVAIALVGAFVVCENYPLSMDEFMATFDAVIIGHGQAVAPIAPPWRAFSPALQTMFMLPTPNRAVWASAYLPINAALRALADVLGAARALNPLLAGVSVVAVYAVGHRLWPNRRDLPLIAAALLATSSQLLVTAMTPYAMTAHLALNFIWLWLFLRGGALGHGGALIVAFLACGLHQIAFHPLFAAPFVLQLWMERRWRPAALYTVAYTAICAFWILYWPIVLALSGVAVGHGGSLGGPGLMSQVTALFSDFDPADVGLMAKNLIRLLTWQNPLCLPLAAVGFVAAIRGRGALRSLAIGLVLTTLVMFALQPYQGHGWGYRYLHGLLGSMCLIAASAWGRFTDTMETEERSVANAGFVAVAAVSVVVLLPIRAWQAHCFLHPYAAAEAAVRRSRAGIVLVNDNGIWFGQDLVRNDPYLRNRPLVMNIAVLTAGQIRFLCAHYTIALFDRRDAPRFGIRTFPTSARRVSDLEAPLRTGCATPPEAIMPKPDSAHLGLAKA